MARKTGCVYCRSKDCNGRCRRSDLQREIRKLRDEIAALTEGERAAEIEMDRLVKENRQKFSESELQTLAEIVGDVAWIKDAWSDGFKSIVAKLGVDRITDAGETCLACKHPKSIHTRPVSILLGTDNTTSGCALCGCNFFLQTPRKNTT